LGLRIEYYNFVLIELNKRNVNNVRGLISAQSVGFIAL